MKLYYDRRSKNPTYFIQQGIRNEVIAKPSSVEHSGDSVA